MIQVPETTKDKVFSLLGYLACVAEKAYMRERQLVEMGHPNNHIIDYWYWCVMELIRCRGLLRCPPMNFASGQRVVS